MEAHRERFSSKEIKPTMCNKSAVNYWGSVHTSKYLKYWLRVIVGTGSKLIVSKSWLFQSTATQTKTVECCCVNRIGGWVKLAKNGCKSRPCRRKKRRYER
eukprot:g16291.t1